ncbi:MAG: N4-gp56 family major capsid protein [Clostridia bacterium]|nr:N4-gp56 family major capsid protein [Clostridia bacterium]
MKKIYFENFNLQLFADITANMTKTTTDLMSPTMKEFYDTTLLENAKEEMVWNQFGKEQTVTHGNSVEWRKFKTFSPAVTPLEEGVAPAGSSLGMENVTATLSQHGDFVSVSDVLEYEAYDDVIFGAAEEMGTAGGETEDLLTRNAVLTGTGVSYCPLSNGTVPASRAQLDGTSRLTPEMVNKAATYLKKMKAPKINGYYVAIIHPSVAEDLRNSDEWKEFHKYNSVQQIFKGEIGELHGVKFIESNTAKVYAQDSGAVYATVFFGKDAWGKVALEGAGMEMIIKDKSEIGGPLEQFSTIGYKFMHGAKILYEERVIRVESNSSYNDDAN